MDVCKPTYMRVLAILVVCLLPPHLAFSPACFWLGMRRRVDGHCPSRRTMLAAADPCNRICRYKRDFFDGQVCIGCFREISEIRSYGSMSAREVSWCAESMAERRQEWTSRSGVVEEMPESPVADYGGFEPVPDEDCEGAPP